MKKTDPPIIVEQKFNISVEKVWEALTNIDLMKQWFFDNIESFEPGVGFTTAFTVKNEDRIFTHLWKLTEVIPLQKITYNWKYKEYPGDSFVTFELSEDKNHVTLKLSTTVVENFPQDIPEFKRESCVGGWNYFVKNRLKNFLEGNIDH